MCIRPAVFEERPDGTRRYLRGEELRAALAVGPQPESYHFGPCGRCEPCIASAASRWSSRGRQEAALFEYCYLATLSYRPDAYPLGQAAVERDVRLWLKSLRVGRKGQVIRTMGCTELGDRTRRPHAHVLILCDEPFEVGEVVKSGARGDPVYRCDEVERHWPHGFAGLSGGLSSVVSAGLVPYACAHQSEPGLGSMMLCDHEWRVDDQDKQRRKRPAPVSVFLKGADGGRWLPLRKGWLCHPEGGLYLVERGGRVGAWRAGPWAFERRRDEDSLVVVSPDERLRVRVHWYERTVDPVSGQARFFRPSASLVRSPGLGYEWADKYGLAAVRDGALVDRGGVRLPLPHSVRRRVTRDMSDEERLALGADARAQADERARAKGATPGGWDTTPERRSVQLECFRARRREESAGRGAL